MFTPSAKLVPLGAVSRPPPPSSRIESIPYETLMHIMQFTVFDPGPPYNTLFAALRLSHVSRHFRFVAHGASELWTLICPNFPLADDQVQFWLEVLARSKARLLNVVINVQVEILGATQPYSTFLEAVVNHSDRWRKFEITSKVWEPIGLFLDHSRRLVLLPRLEELTLHHSDDPGRTANREEVSAPRFHNILFGKDVVAPKLNIVKLGATYFDHSSIRSIAKDLVELHFENHTYPRTSDVPEMIIDLLRASPRLQVLTLTSVNLQFDNFPSPVELRYLRKLEFRGLPRNVVLLSLVRVPALEVLYLGECRFAAGPGSAVLPSLFTAELTLRALIGFFTSPENSRWYWRAGGLRELSLEYTHCSVAREAKRFLRLTVNVETLRTSCSAILPILANHPEILPNLQHLVVKSSIFYDWDLFSVILTNRPDVTFSVEGDLTPDGERLYNTLKGTHNITLCP